MEWVAAARLALRMLPSWCLTCHNSSIKNRPAGTAKTILAYEKDVPASGGLVLMAEGSVRSMTADEFKKTPKAAGK